MAKFNSEEAYVADFRQFLSAHTQMHYVSDHCYGFRQSKHYNWLGDRTEV